MYLLTTTNLLSVQSIALFFLVFSSQTRTKFRERISQLTGSTWMSGSDSQAK